MNEVEFISKIYFMMTNNTPWQAIVNTNHLSKAITTENNLAVVKKITSSMKSLSTNSKSIMPKRFSFDDNGGGYQGL